MEVQQYIDHATSIKTAQGLEKSEENNQENRVPLVITYHPTLCNLPKILRRHLPILQVSEGMKQVVLNPPLMAYRRPKNLNDLLFRATLKPPEQIYEGTRQCERLCCKTCAHIKMGIRFSSTVTSEKFRARTTVNCKTSNVVCLIVCNKCNEQYVGATENPSFKVKWP